MSVVFKTIGKISGILAGVLAPINPILAGAFALNSAIMGTAASLTAKKPPNFVGSTADIRIGADHPAPLMIGDTYS
ncbi:MAG: hypothetical protein EOP58_11775, partial [Sphingomonadales bacterium]